MTVRAQRTPQEAEKFVANLRVSSISDQDDAGPWIRREFPVCFLCCAAIDAHQWRILLLRRGPASAAISTIAMSKGADSSVVTNEWLDDEYPQQRAAGQGVSAIRFIHGGRHAVVSRIDRQWLERFQGRLGRLGRRYIYRQPYRRDARYLDAGRR